MSKTETGAAGVKAAYFVPASLAFQQRQSLRFVFEL